LNDDCRCGERGRPSSASVHFFSRTLVRRRPANVVVCVSAVRTSVSPSRLARELVRVDRPHYSPSPRPDRSNTRFTRAPSSRSRCDRLARVPPDSAVDGVYRSGGFRVHVPRHTAGTRHAVRTGFSFVGDFHDLATNHCVIAPPPSPPPPHRPRRPPYLFVECVRSFGSFTVGPRSREYLDHQFLARSFRGHGRRRRTAAPRRGPLVFERRYRPRRYDSSFVPCDGPLITRLWYVLFADDPNYFDKLLTHLRTFLPFLTKVIDSSELLEIQPDHVTKLQCLYELVDNKRFAFGLKPYNMYTFVNYVYVIEQFAPVFGPSFLNRNIEISYIMTSFFLV